MLAVVLVYECMRTILKKKRNVYRPHMSLKFFGKNSFSFEVLNVHDVLYKNCDLFAIQTWRNLSSRT